MTYLYGFLHGFALACFIWAAVFFWLDKRRRKTPPITMHRRRNRDREQIPEQIRGGEQIQSEVGGIDYRWINLAGETEE